MTGYRIEGDGADALVARGMAEVDRLRTDGGHPMFALAPRPGARSTGDYEVVGADPLVADDSGDEALRDSARVLRLLALAATEPTTVTFGDAAVQLPLLPPAASFLFQAARAAETHTGANEYRALIVSANAFASPDTMVALGTIAAEDPLPFLAEEPEGVALARVRIVLDAEPRLIELLGLAGTLVVAAEVAGIRHARRAIDAAARIARTQLAPNTFWSRLRGPGRPAEQ